VRFFVYEYVSAGLDATLPASLRQEGAAMLRAVVADLARIAGAEVRTLLAAPVIQLAGCSVELFSPGGEESAFRLLSRWADFSLVIAPEFDNILYKRCRWVEEEKGGLLGPCSSAVALTGDKLALGEHLRAHGVRTPDCHALDDSSLRFPVVCKPRFGAGSLATFLIDQRHSPGDCLNVARAEGWAGELMVQPYVPGIAASEAFLCGPRVCIPLAPAAQHLSDDGRFHYLGGNVPLPQELADRAVRAARSAVHAVAGLNGYVGVDVVLGNDDDWVIEINPRLTTSYLGLRRLAVENLAELMVRVARGERVDPPRWKKGKVRFSTV
jgi:predicted ATP-grasp superfamily ATP-dependent carboligase